MKTSVAIFRVIATVYGAYLLIVSTYFLVSQLRYPSPAATTALDIAAIAGYVFLVLPYRKVDSSTLKAIIFTILSIQLIWTVYSDIHHSIIYYSSDGGWKMVVGLAIGLVILLGNLWAFYAITSKSSGQQNATPGFPIER